jgi:hypothetical protein
MPSSGMLRRVALVRIDVSEERIASIVRVTVTSNQSTLQKIIVLQLLITVNDVPSSPILVTLMMVAIRSSESLVLIRVTQRKNPRRWYS